jgi:uncharacterized damage-inducible protein DinB
MSVVRALQRRHEYNAWANARLAAVLQPEPEHVLRIVSHLLGAERLWLARIEGRRTNHIPVWPELSAEECRALALENREACERFLKGLADDDLARAIEYRNSSGAQFTTLLGDILEHLLLHGAYHRGQVAAALRQSGASPPVTDFIAWVREQ